MDPLENLRFSWRLNEHHLEFDLCKVYKNITKFQNT